MNIRHYISLIEAFNSGNEQITWELQSEREWRGTFAVNGIPFIVEFGRQDDEDAFQDEEDDEFQDDDGSTVDASHWNVHFLIEPSFAARHKLSSTGNTGTSGTAGIKVLSTVIGAIFLFMREVSPWRLTFIAEMDGNDDKDAADVSRKGMLYRNLVRKLEPRITQAGYSTESSDVFGEVTIEFFRN